MHTHSLDIVREALRYTPVAVLGLDDQHMVAFINEAAIELFKELPLLILCRLIIFLVDAMNLLKLLVSDNFSSKLSLRNSNVLE